MNVKLELVTRESVAIPPWSALCNCGLLQSRACLVMSFHLALVEGLMIADCPTPVFGSLFTPKSLNAAYPAG